MRFVDTNVLLYLVSTAAEESTKQRIAAEILEGDDLALSVQVLQEFYAQATRPRASGKGSLTHAQAVQLIESFLRFPVQEMTVAVLHASLAAKQKYGISLWDASILEAARSLGCPTVLSEDLSGGQDYGTVRVVNPFRRE
ncbi:MAG: PIN domain-containing protein [Acidobacteria bacterium]|nr:PIN domain-containing protein [Acidobacteriota bacterium]